VWVAKRKRPHRDTVKPLNLRPHSREEDSTYGLGAVKEGGGGTFPALSSRLQGALGGGGRARRVVDEDVYAILITTFQVVLRHGSHALDARAIRSHAHRLCTAQKKPRSRGERGPGREASFSLGGNIKRAQREEERRAMSGG
jgi:hypothetical protein